MNRYAQRVQSKYTEKSIEGEAVRMRKTIYTEERAR